MVSRFRSRSRRQKKANADISTPLSELIFDSFFEPALDTAVKDYWSHTRKKTLSETRPTLKLTLGHDSVVLKMDLESIVVEANKPLGTAAERELSFDSTKSDLIGAIESVIQEGLGLEKESFQKNRHSGRRRRGFRKGRSRRGHRNVQAGGTLFDLVESYNMGVARQIEEELRSLDDVKVVSEAEPSKTGPGFIGNVTFNVAYHHQDATFVHDLKWDEVDEVREKRFRIGVEAGHRGGDGVSHIANLGRLPTHFLGSIADPGFEVIDPAVAYFFENKEYA